MVRRDEIRLTLFKTHPKISCFGLASLGFGWGNPRNKSLTSSPRMAAHDNGVHYRRSVMHVVKLLHSMEAVLVSHLQKVLSECQPGSGEKAWYAKTLVYNTPSYDMSSKMRGYGTAMSACLVQPFQPLLRPMSRAAVRVAADGLR